MKSKLLLYIIVLLSAISTQAQTVISSKIDFQSERQTHVLITNNNDQFVGKIIAIRNDTVDFKLRNLDNIMHFELSNVTFLGLSGEKQSDYALFTGKKSTSPDKERPIPTNQLLYTTTALPYQGKGAYRNTMVLWNDADLQLGDHFSLGAASIIPIVFSIQAQAKMSFNSTIHAGISTQEYLTIFDGDSFNHTYMMLTVGDHEKYLNFCYGVWTDRFTSFSSREKFINRFPTLSLGGSYDFGTGWRFYIDALAVFDDFATMILPSFSLSRLKGRNMFEIGLVAIPDSGIPLIPLLSYNLVFK